MTMGGRAALIFTILLVLATMGCEREDLRYDDPDTPREEEEKPPTPTPSDDDYRLTDLLAGEWQGSATMDFIDSDNQWKHNEFDDVRLSFSLPEGNALWGKGQESDYKDGKRVWMMNFTWQVDSTETIILKYTDGRQMTSTSKKYELDDNTFHAVFVSKDLTETDEYTLKRVTP